MAELIHKIMDFLLGPRYVMGETGFDPSQEGIKGRAKRKTALIWFLCFASIAACGTLVWSVSRVAAALKATSTPVPSATWTPEASATLPGPGVLISQDTATPGSGDTNILTAMANQPTASPSPTKLEIKDILTSFAPSVTPCAASGQALTEIACNSVSLTETMTSVGVGTPVSASGIDLNSTTIYVYPTPYPPTQTPWIIEASATQTPVVITATQGPTQTPWVQVVIVTATPGPTQTPWFFITQPPVITVVWTQQVTVVVPVTVVVTATPTDTQPPTDTPMPTETPTP